MSYQPPARQGFDPKSVNPLDWGIIAAGVLALIFSFLDYYTVTASKGAVSASDSGSAWHGFFGWFAALLALAGAAAVAMALFAPQVGTRVPQRLAGLALFAVATLCVIVAVFVFPESDDIDNLRQIGVNVDEGHGIGYWLSLIVIIAGTVLSLMRLQATGGQLPGGLQKRVPNIGGYGPQGGIDGGVGRGPGSAGGPPPPPPTN